MHNLLKKVKKCTFAYQCQTKLISHASAVRALVRLHIESNFHRLNVGVHAVFGTEYYVEYHSDDRFDTGGRTLNEQLHNTRTACAHNYTRT